MHPSYFNQSLRGHLTNELRRQVEGTCSGRLGYIVAVVLEEMDSSGSHRGRIMEDGQAVFSIKYRAVVYRPFRNEVVDGVVSSVNKVRGPFFSRGSNFCRREKLTTTTPRPDGHLCRRRTFTVLHLDARESASIPDERTEVLTDNACSWSRQTLALIPTRTRLASRARKTR